MEITAAVVEAKGEPFRIRTLELDEPGAGEVLVRVAATGVCHTDLIIRDQWYPVPLPAVLGHEGAGVVEAVGAGVEKVAPGDHVVLTFASCGSCPLCVSGQPTYCLDFYDRNFGGARPDGSNALRRDDEPVHGFFFGQSSFATYAVATERNVVLVPDDAPLELLGPLGCGIQTGAGGVMNALRPPAGSSCAVFGTGAVGLSAVMAAHICGCTTVIGIDIVPSRLELASELGATQVIDANEGDPVEAIREITGGGADYTLETTAVPAVLRQAVEALAHRGTCGLIGAAPLGTEVSLDMNNVMIPGRTLRGIIEGDSQPDVFIPRLVELHRQGRFPFDRLVAFFDLETINEAAEQAESGAVIKPVLRMR